MFSLDVTISDRFNEHKHLGSGNLTALTGLLPALLPDVCAKIVNAITSIHPELEWGTYFTGEELGIRSARLVSYDSKVPMPTRQDILDMRERLNPKGAMVLGADHSEHDPTAHEDADEHVVKFIKREPVSKFSVILVLTPRPRYAGGAVVAQKKAVLEEEEKEDVVDMYDEDEEDRAYNEPNEIDDPKNIKQKARSYAEQTGNVIPEERKSKEQKEKEAKQAEEDARPKFNALTTKYGRYVPESGTALFIRSDHPHTVMPLKKGYRDYLAVELWSYQHAPVPSGSANPFARTSITEAKPFPPKKDEL